MGDRAIIVVTDGHGNIGAASIYLHWAGESAMAFIREAAKLMGGRKGDIGYASARLCGICHENIPGNLSLGLIPPPKEMTDACLKKYSHGDAGVLLWNCQKNTVTGYGGYLRTVQDESVEESEKTETVS